jgi:membrane-associated phospholipid phosphatase
MLDRFTNRFVTSVFLLVVLSFPLGAQTLPPAPPLNSPTLESSQESTVARPEEPSLKLPSKDDYFSKGFARQLLSDQKPLWTSPARIKASDVKWLAPLAAGTAFLFTQDNSISHHFDNKTSLQDASTKVSAVGLYAPWVAPGAFLALGKATGNVRMADTGKKGFQAAIYSQAVVQAMKFITDRTRPADGGDGGFWNGGKSFPSGHAMQAWALAKVVSDEYSDKPIVKIGMYSFATAVSLSRITAQKHYPSDVLVGSAVGYLIGKFVMRNHHAELQASPSPIDSSSKQ